MEVSGQRHSLTSLYSGKNPVSIRTDAGLASAGLDVFGEEAISDQVSNTVPGAKRSKVGFILLQIYIFVTETC
jgi:hypothetical protein